MGKNFFITKSSLRQKLSGSSTLNTSGGANILKDDILRAYENLNCSTEIFSDGNFSRINSKTSSDVVSGVRVTFNNRHAMMLQLTGNNCFEKFRNLTEFI